MHERVRMLRSMMRLSRVAFGYRLGVSGDVINNIERGRVQLKEPLLKLICSVFNVNETWIRTGEGAIFTDVPETELDTILKDYDLTRKDYAIIQKFVSAPPEVRGVLEAFIVETANAIRNAEKAAPAETVILNAAHERTDRESSEAEKAHDNALLDNWEGNE